MNWLLIGTAAYLVVAAGVYWALGTIPQGGHVGPNPRLRRVLFSLGWLPVLLWVAWKALT